MIENIFIGIISGIISGLIVGYWFKRQENKVFAEINLRNDIENVIKYLQLVQLEVSEHLSDEIRNTDRLKQLLESRPMFKSFHNEKNFPYKKTAQDTWKSLNNLKKVIDENNVSKNIQLLAVKISCGDTIMKLSGYETINYESEKKV